MACFLMLFQSFREAFYGKHFFKLEPIPEPENSTL